MIAFFAELTVLGWVLIVIPLLALVLESALSSNRYEETTGWATVFAVFLAAVGWHFLVAPIHPTFSGVMPFVLTYLVGMIVYPVIEWTLRIQKYAEFVGEFKKDLPKVVSSLIDRAQQELAVERGYSQRKRDELEIDLGKLMSYKEALLRDGKTYPLDVIGPLLDKSSVVEKYQPPVISHLCSIAGEVGLVLRRGGASQGYWDEVAPSDLLVPKAATNTDAIASWAFWWPWYLTKWVLTDFLVWAGKCVSKALQYPLDALSSLFLKGL